VGGVHDLRASGDRRNRQPARDALGGENDVRDHTEVLAREVPARTGHAALDLVGDEDDAVSRAPVLERGEVAVRGHDESALALDRFRNDAREVGGPDGLLQPRDGASRGIRPAQAIAERV